MATSPSKDVFLLGAGFSQAISEDMPLTSGLFPRLRRAMKGLDLEAGGDSTIVEAYERFQDLEVWLTWLATDHPWLMEAGGYRNRAGFSDASRALARVILEAQTLAISTLGSPPPWLWGLVNTWSNNGSAVITLNYDALVEKTWETIIPGTSRVLFTFMPAHPSGAGYVGGAAPSHRFPYFKLHGSVTWYTFPAAWDVQGPIMDADLNNGWTTPDEVIAVEQRMGARQPLIVPPVVSKDAYFARPELREQWMRADQMLRNASRLIILGYSFPSADFQMRFLLDRCPPTCRIIPVDINPDHSNHMERLLKPRTVERDHCGAATAIRDFATSYVPSFLAFDPSRVLGTS